MKSDEDDFVHVDELNPPQFKIIDNYHSKSAEDHKDEIIKLLRESKIRLEQENNEMKESLNESKRIQAENQERTSHLITENTLLREKLKSIIEENNLLKEQKDRVLTEEKLKSILNQTSDDLFGKLDENFKVQLNVIRERNINIRGGNPFPFTPDKSMAAPGLLTPFMIHPWLLSGRKVHVDEKEKD